MRTELSLTTYRDIRAIPASGGNYDETKKIRQWTSKAVGEVVQIPDLVDGKPALTPLTITLEHAQPNCYPVGFDQFENWDAWLDAQPLVRGRDRFGNELDGGDPSGRQVRKFYVDAITAMQLQKELAAATGKKVTLRDSTETAGNILSPDEDREAKDVYVNGVRLGAVGELLERKYANGVGNSGFWNADGVWVDIADRAPAIVGRLEFPIVLPEGYTLQLSQNTSFEPGQMVVVAPDVPVLEGSFNANDRAILADVQHMLKILTAKG